MGASVIVDVLVVLSLIGALVDGLRRGLLRTLGGLAGIVAGAIGASFAVPAVSSWAAGSEWRLLAVIGTAVLLLGVGYAIGATLGAVIGRGADRVKLGLLDRLAGGVAGVAISGLVWIAVTSAVSLLGVPLVTTSVAGSTVIRTIDDLTPPPSAPSSPSCSRPWSTRARPGSSRRSTLRPGRPRSRTSPPTTRRSPPPPARSCASPARPGPATSE